jgi:hypothetical protein
VEIKTVNMNDGVNFEVPGETRLFSTNPFALEFKHSGVEGFVAVAATNRLLRVTLDGAGVPTINAPAAALNPGDPSPIIRVQLRDPNDPSDVVATGRPSGTRCRTSSAISAWCRAAAASSGRRAWPRGPPDSR